VVADHHMRVDRISSTPKKVLIVVANPATSTTLGWPVGFWGAELTHPYYELTERGVEVAIASPDGGKVEMDSLSDPRDPPRWSSEDLVTMGFVNTPELIELLENSRSWPTWTSTSSMRSWSPAGSRRCSPSVRTKI
jgi:putative intracellular protease/amidase